MKGNSLLKKSTIYFLITALFVSAIALLGLNIKNNVLAEDTTHTVTFYQEHYGFENIEITVNDGDTLVESQIPALPEDEGIHEYIWINLDALENITSDVAITLQRRINPIYKYTVTFIFPDGTTKTQQVVHGGSIVDPPTSDNLGFGEKDSYSVKLDNITSDMDVIVTIDKTWKYVTIALCGAVLVAGLVACALVVFNMVNSKNEENKNNENNPTPTENK